MVDQTFPEISPSVPASTSTNQDSDEISLLEVLIVLAEHKKVIIVMPVLIGLLSVVYALWLPNVYTATTKILPPQQSQSVAFALTGQVGAAGGLASGIAGLRNPNDVYVAMLKSRTLADRLSKRFGLMVRYDVDNRYPSLIYDALAGATKIGSGKDGIITIEVDDKEPKFAAELANAFVDELVTFTSEFALTEASQRRLFFERQFAWAREKLVKAEAAARQALQTGGLVKVDEQGRAMMEVTSRLRGQIAVKGVEIRAMQTFAAERNPDLQRAQKELESLKHELARIEGVAGAKASIDNPRAQGGESLHLLRDVKYHEVVVDLLARQYELARVDEAKDASIIQVIDKAIEPDRKSKPNRRMIVLLCTLVGAVVAILYAIVSDRIAKLRVDVHQAGRLRALRRYLAWR